MGMLGASWNVHEVSGFDILPLETIASLNERLARAGHDEEAFGIVRVTVQRHRDARGNRADHHTVLGARSGGVGQQFDGWSQHVEQLTHLVVHTNWFHASSLRVWIVIRYN